MEKILEFVTQEWDLEHLIIIYNRRKFRIMVADLSEDAKALINENMFVSCQFKGKGYMKKGLLDTKSIVLETISDHGPILLHRHEYIETDYVRYSFGANELDVQRNGFLVYCAPTGQGKTYFALSNLERLSKQAEIVLYINLELSVDDIYNRVVKMGLDIPKNVYVAPFEQVSLIESFARNMGRMIIIVDNIDNLVGGGQDPFGEQLEFIKRLDRFLKDENHHALILTQLVKDSNISLIGKDGYINDALNTNILSGVKQLSYLSRSVMMTAWSPPLETYDYKILKMGSGKLYEKV